MLAPNRKLPTSKNKQREGRLKQKLCHFLGWWSCGESEIANDVLFTTMTERTKRKGSTKIAAAIDNPLVSQQSLKSLFKVLSKSCGVREALVDGGNKQKTERSVSFGVFCRLKGRQRGGERTPACAGTETYTPFVNLVPFAVRVRTSCCC